MALGCEVATPASPVGPDGVEPPLVADGELATGGVTVAEIALETGGRLRFIELGPAQVALLEATPAGAPGIHAVAELDRDASLADVFFAFSEPGTELPAELLAVSEPSTAFGAQGWARPLLAAAAVPRSNCVASTFRDWVEDRGYDDRGTPDVRLDQVPRNSQFFRFDEYAPGNGESYDFYEYSVGGNDGSVWYDVDRYATQVTVCAVDQAAGGNPGGLAHPPISYQGYSNPHMGPAVTVWYRRPGEETWTAAASRDFAANEIGGTIRWHFNTGSNWDWMTRIYWAGGDDRFHIGHAVEDL
jgi:hypothetical protein